MKWKILTVGKPALEYARLGVEEYLRRLQRQTSVEWQPVKSLPVEKTPGALWLVLDERGDLLSTETLRQKVDAWELSAVKRIEVLIGGAGGHSQDVRHRADCLLALSPLTLQHELALIVFLEQLYRIYTLKRGEPYHR